MIHSFIHTSEKNNFYIYDDQHRLSMLIHPRLEEVYKSTTDVDPYYVGKYAYLKIMVFSISLNLRSLIRL